MLAKTILVIDDDPLFCDIVAQHFQSEDIAVFTARDGSQGLQQCSERRIDVVLLDQQLPDAEGKDLCPAIMRHNEQCKIIFATGFPSFENALEAIKFGAHDYLSKPIELAELELAVAKAFRTLDLERTEQLRTYLNEREGCATVLVGLDKGLAQVGALMAMAGKSAAPVLITGETGTGKSLVAKAIHFGSASRDRAFIPVNCAAFPENLVESELFGYDKGAFSGAVSARRGLFEMAENGALCLEEIGEMPFHLQSKLLGVLDEGTVKRLGSETFRPVNVRILATTNVDLEEAIAAKRFRKDLYYRLGVMRIHVPALRERTQDLPDLCRHFLRAFSRDQDAGLDQAELDRLSAYAWPGNVRELKNILERAVILSQGGRIMPSQLLDIPERPARLAARATEPEAAALPSLRRMEEAHIKAALAACNNNHTRTAKILGISRSTLMRKLGAMR